MAQQANADLKISPHIDNSLGKTENIADRWRPWIPDNDDVIPVRTRAVKVIGEGVFLVEDADGYVMPCRHTGDADGIFPYMAVKIRVSHASVEETTSYGKVWLLW